MLCNLWKKCSLFQKTWIHKMSSFLFLIHKLWIKPWNGPFVYMCKHICVCVYDILSELICVFSHIMYIMYIYVYIQYNINMYIYIYISGSWNELLVESQIVSWRTCRKEVGEISWMTFYFSSILTAWKGHWKLEKETWRFLCWELSCVPHLIPFREEGWRIPP